MFLHQLKIYLTLKIVYNTFRLAIRKGLYMYNCHTKKVRIYDSMSLSKLFNRPTSGLTLQKVHIKDLFIIDVFLIVHSLSLKKGIWRLHSLF